MKLRFYNCKDVYLIILKDYEIIVPKLHTIVRHMHEKWWLL